MEYLKYAFTGMNILPSILLLIIIFYWLMTILGFLSVDSLNLDFGVDFDMDMDLDADVDVDIDSDVDLDANVNSNKIPFTMKVLKFSNLGAIPFMIYLTIFILILWSLSMLTYYLNISPSSLTGALAFIVGFFITFFITAISTKPLVNVFKALEDKTKIEVIGSSCILKSDADENLMGIAEVDNKDYPIVINVKSLNGLIKKGERAIIVSQDGSNNLYKIEKNKYF